jgi:hypothetical protein
MLGIFIEARDYVHGPGRDDDPAAREARVRDSLTRGLSLLQPEEAASAFLSLLVDDLTAYVMKSLNAENGPGNAGGS